MQRRFGPYRITRITGDSLLSGAPGSTGYYLAFDTDVGILAVTFKSGNLPAGVYFCRLDLQGERHVHGITLQR